MQFITEYHSCPCLIGMTGKAGGDSTVQGVGGKEEVLTNKSESISENVDEEHVSNPRGSWLIFVLFSSFHLGNWPDLIFEIQYPCECEFKCSNIPWLPSHHNFIHYMYDSRVHYVGY